MKVFLDGDRAHPTLAGTGTEDYVGSGYGLERPYAQRNEGLLVANPKAGHWLFYRLHLPDPIYFSSDCEVRLQQIGGAPRTRVLALQKAGVPLRPVTLDPGGRAHFVQLLDGKPHALDDPELPDGWTNFYRRDDVAATAYYYLDRLMRHPAKRSRRWPSAWPESPGRPEQRASLPWPRDDVHGPQARRRRARCCV